MIKLKQKLGLLLCMATASTLSAQVTIGSEYEPNEGALLDLKSEIDGTATKGMAMPRIALTDVDDLINIDPSNPMRPNEEEHTGLAVYNVTENNDFCPGLYVWTGDTWIPLKQRETQYFTDTRTKADGTIESITYPIGEFGAAGVWMLQNLRATTYADNLGVAKATNDIKLVAATNNLEKSYHYPNLLTNILNTKPEYGLLYSWYAATNGKSTAIGDGETAIVNEDPPIPNPNVENVGVQGICPDGWHLPSDKEWNDLEEAISNEQTGLYTIGSFRTPTWDPSWRLASSMRNDAVSGKGHGIAMFSSDVAAVNNRLIGGQSSPCGGGFNIYPVGRILNGNGSEVYGLRAYMWTSSSSATATGAWTRLFITRNGGNPGGGVSRYTYSREQKLSVRCKQD